MKYLKLFEALDTACRTRTDELKKFCTENLAYLIDNNFSFIVRVSREAQIQSDSNFQTTIKYPSNSKYDTIIVEKLITSKVYSEVFDFNEFSDDLVPFILFLNEKYGINSIFYLDENRRVKWPGISREEYNSDDIDLSSLDDKKIKKLVITIRK